MTHNYYVTPFKQRTITLGQRVKVYRNLHKSSAAGCGAVYSIADADTGLVLGHSVRVTLTEAEFVVRQAGRQQVLREKKKNVHAYVTGCFQGTSGATQDYAAYYNPYRTETFVRRTPEGELEDAVYRATIVTLASNGVTYSDEREEPK